jgi:hypothetical protein
MTGKLTTSACKCNHPSYYPYSNHGPLRFVDRDMFVCYTHYGIGHPKVVREMVRDCTNTEFADSSDSEEDEDRDRERDIHSCEVDSERDGDEDGHEGEDLGDHEDEDEDATECDDDEQLDDDPLDDCGMDEVEDEDGDYHDLSF